MIELVSVRASVNAVQLAAIIRVTYKTAWSILHKIRRAISKLDKERRMAGLVKGGVAFYGRLPYVYYRTDREYPLWVSCAQEQQVRRDNGFDRNSGLYVKIKCLTNNDLYGQKLAYAGEKRMFEEHMEGQAVSITLNRMEFCRDALLSPLYKQAKDWINQTFGGIGGKYQQAYWDEFCFRLNYMHHETPVVQVLTDICMGQTIYLKRMAQAS